MTRWTERDLPVLRAIYELEEERGNTVFFTAAEIGERAELDAATVGRSLGFLESDYLSNVIGTFDDSAANGVTPNGLRALGEWPSGDELARALPDILRALADREPDAEKSSLLKRGADILQGLVVSTASAVIKEVTGLG